MNRFYNLPEDLLILIYKKYYSTYVLHELLSIPGNFSFMINDDWWTTQLERDYRIIDKIGPGAWSFLKESDYNFIMYADRYNVMYKKICNGVGMDSGHSANSFELSLYIMQNIAKNGWERYTRDPVHNYLITI